MAEESPGHSSLSSPFDLVLMDVQMPEVGGFEATAMIRAREQAAGGHLPIIAMTAHAMKGDRERCLAAGMDGYVAKPIQAKELSEAIARMTAASRPATPRGDAPLAATGVDWDRALQGVGGDREILQELVGVFLGVWPDWLGKLREAVARNDLAVLRRMAHTVKGSLGQFGAEAACAAAQRLEALGQEGNLAGAEEACAALEEELRRVAPALSDFTHTGP